MKRIVKLTTDQIARFPEFVEKWTRIGLCTDPADRPRAEAGIRTAYEAAGLVAPKSIVWCGSPLSQGITRAIVFGFDNASVRESVRRTVRESVWRSVGDSVRDSVGESAWDSLRESVGESVRESVWRSVWQSVWQSAWDSLRESVWRSVRESAWRNVRDSVWRSVRRTVRESVWRSVGDSVRDSVWQSVRDSLRDSVGESVGESVWGQHDAGWLSIYDYYRLVCGLEEQTRWLAGLWEVAQSANWWLPHKNICWVSERPCVLNRNSAGQLHCVIGPALSYPDGWKLWYIGGVAVDEQIVMRPETQTIEQIQQEENNDVRAIRCERYGWEKYLTDSGAQLIDERMHPRDETAERLYRDPKGDCRIIVVDPATRKNVVLGVPADVKTCAEAQNWMSHGFDSAAMVRT